MPYHKVLFYRPLKLQREREIEGERGERGSRERERETKMKRRERVRLMRHSNDHLVLLYLKFMQICLKKLPRWTVEKKLRRLDKRGRLLEGNYANL